MTIKKYYKHEISRVEPKRDTFALIEPDNQRYNDQEQESRDSLINSLT